MIEIVNNQRKVKLELQIFKNFTDAALNAVKEARSSSVTVAFVSDRKMSELNKQFRGKTSTTDVLSFPFTAEKFEAEINHLGDIVISAEQAVRQADENQLTLAHEIKQLIVHGILHLCGYDHETDDGEMDARELELRQVLRI